MKLYSLLEEQKKIYAFYPKQINPVLSKLNRIIAKEADPKVKSRFTNLAGLLKGRYPSARSMLAAIKGTEKIIMQIAGGLNEATDKKNTLKKVISTALAVLVFTSTILSCQLQPTSNQQAWDDCKEYILNPSNEPVFYITIDSALIDLLDKALDDYFANGTTTILDPYNIKMTSDIDAQWAGITNPSGAIKIRTGMDKAFTKEVLSHEMTHRKQYGSMVDMGITGDYLTGLGYTLNKAEINARMNSYVRVAEKIADGRLTNYNDIINSVYGLSNENLMAMLLVYRADGRSYGGISANKIKMVHDMIKKYNHSFYSDYLKIKDNPDKIKEYFFTNHDPSGIKSVAPEQQKLKM